MSGKIFITESSGQNTAGMESFLAGWLMRALDKKGREAMKIVSVVPSEAANGFVVTFASGLELAVYICHKAEGS